MKVSMPKDYKEYFTVRDVEKAKEVIKCMKDDESTVDQYALYAAREVLKGSKDGWPVIIEATAEIAKNNRAFNAYGETGDLDVLIEAKAKTDLGYLEFSAYLSDIFQTGADYDYRDQIYYVYYAKAKLERA